MNGVEVRSASPWRVCLSVNMYYHHLAPSEIKEEVRGAERRGEERRGEERRETEERRGEERS